VFHGGKGGVEVVKETTPFLIAAGLTKTDGVVFETLPVD